MVVGGQDSAIYTAVGIKYVIFITYSVYRHKKYDEKQDGVACPSCFFAVMQLQKKY